MTDSSTGGQAPQHNRKASKSTRNVVLAAKGGGIDFAGQMIARVLQFLFSVVVARFLGAQQYGLYRLGVSVTSLQSNLATLGLQAGMMRYIPIAREQKDDKQLWEVIQAGLFGPGLIGLTLGLLLLVFADVVAIQIFDNPALTPVLRFLSWLIPLQALLTMTTGISQGFKQMHHRVYAQNIVARTIKLVLVTIFLLAGFRVMSVVFAQLAASAAGLVVFLYLINNTFSLKRRLNISRSVIKELLRFSLPLFVGGILLSLGGSFETLVLGFFGMTAGVGIYGIAVKVSSLSNLFHSSLGSIATPLFSELHTRQEYDQLKTVYQTTTKWAISFSLPFFLTIFFYGEPLLSIFGREFQTGATTLLILVSGSFFSSFTGQSGSMINMIGRSKINAVNSGVYLVATVVFDLLFIPSWGTEGAAIASSLTVILVNLLRMTEVYVLLRFWPFNWGFLKPFGATFVAAATVYTVSQSLVRVPIILQTIIGIPLIWGVYGLVIALLGLSSEDRLILHKLKKRLLRMIRR